MRGSPQQLLAVCLHIDLFRRRSVRVNARVCVHVCANICMTFFFFEHSLSLSLSLYVCVCICTSINLQFSNFLERGVCVCMYVYILAH